MFYRSEPLALRSETRAPLDSRRFELAAGGQPGAPSRAAEGSRGRPNAIAQTVILSDFTPGWNTLAGLIETVGMNSRSQAERHVKAGRLPQAYEANLRDFPVTWINKEPHVLVMPGDSVPLDQVVTYLNNAVDPRFHTLVIVGDKLPPTSRYRDEGRRVMIAPRTTMERQLGR